MISQLIVISKFDIVNFDEILYLLLFPFIFHLRIHNTTTKTILKRAGIIAITATTRRPLLL